MPWARPPGQLQRGAGGLVADLVLAGSCMSRKSGQNMTKPGGQASQLVTSEPQGCTRASPGPQRGMGADHGAWEASTSLEKSLQTHNVSREPGGQSRHATRATSCSAACRGFEGSSLPPPWPRRATRRPSKKRGWKALAKQRLG